MGFSPLTNDRVLIGVTIVLIAALTTAAQNDDFSPVPPPSYPAFLQAEKVVVLSAEVDGLIAAIHAEPGAYVDADDVLVQLDEAVIRSRLKGISTEIDLSTDAEEAAVNLAYANDNFSIIEKLYNQQIGGARVGSEKEFREATQRLEMAHLAVKKATLQMELLKVNLEQTEIILGKHTIQAPMDGVIVPFTSVRGYEELKKAPAAGEMVQPGRPILALMKVDRLQVSEPKPVGQLDAVRMGQAARIYVLGADDPIDGEVVYISPTIGSTGQFNITVEFANPTADDANGPFRFRPGMRARIELQDN